MGSWKRHAASGASALVAAVTAVAACSSFEDAEEPSPSGGDASPESATTTDGTTTDGPALDAATSSCDATFCSGFDEAPYDTGWQLTGTVDAGLGATNESPRSPPNALRAQLDPGGHGGELHHRRVFAGRYRRARFELALRVQKPPGGGTYQVATIGWGGPRVGSATDRISEMQILVDDKNLRPKHDEDPHLDGGKVDDPGEVFGYATGSWYVVEIALGFEPSKNVKARVTIDGQVLFDRTFASYGEPADLDVGVGIAGAFTTITSTGLTDIDDVRVWLEPE